MNTLVRFGVVLVVMLLAGAAKAEDTEQKKAVKALVEKMQTAVLKDDFGAVLDMTHPAVVKQLGGREKGIDALKAFTKEMKDKGITFKVLPASEPGDFVPGKQGLYTIVPTKLELTFPKGKALTTSSLLGVSTDGGKTWKFVDGSLGPDAIRKMIPDLPEKIEIPKTETKVTKD